MAGQVQVRVGGSFAPPITPETLAQYKGLASKAEPRVKDGMTELITMLEEFNKTPVSTLFPVLHMSGAANVIPLTPEEIVRIDHCVPWDHELEAIGKVFNAIKDTVLRKAAFHLLWYGWELFRDREPITNDKVGK